MARMTHIPNPRRAARFLPTALTWRFGVVVLLLTLISLAIGTRSSIRVNQNTRCLADYIARNSEVSQARAAATSEKDNANNALLDAVTALIAHPPKDPAAAQKILRQASNEYARKSAALKATRAANPLPEFPKECGAANDSHPSPTPGAVPAS